MKRVIYTKKCYEYLITDKEFAEALMKWNEKRSYWCNRLEVLLSPFPAVVETPREELGRKIMLDLRGDEPRRIFKNKNGDYMEILDESGKLMSCSIDKDKIVEFERTLVSQDDFYNKKENKLLKREFKNEEKEN